MACSSSGSTRCQHAQATEVEPALCLPLELLDRPFAVGREPSHADDLVKLVGIVDDHRLVIVVNDNLRASAYLRMSWPLKADGRLMNWPAKLTFSKSALNVRCKSCEYRSNSVRSKLFR